LVPAISDRIYLDHAATTPLRPEAKAAMEEGFRIWANPSSPHAEGRRARAALEDARERVKRALGWDGEVIFTSGASEAAALAVTGCKKRLTMIGSIEHDAVQRFQGDAKEWPTSEGTGLLGPAWADGFDGLVAVQHANSETGVTQDAERIRMEVNRGGGWWLCDCAQTAGKLELPDADMIIVAAHKFGGPIGIGALLVRDYALLEPVGGHERGYRRGTENLPAAMGMAAALEADPSWYAEAQLRRAWLDDAITLAGGEVVAAHGPRLATISSYRMPGMSSGAQLMRFDAAGIAVSAGSACSSGTLKESRVLRAMWYSHPSEVIRVSFGWTTTQAEVERFAEIWIDLAKSAPPRA
jgi:cysteine desulfurase